MVDTYFNFNDFWNFVAYEYANTIWNSMLRDRSFQPKRELHDPEGMPDHYDRVRHIRYSERQELIMKGLRSQISGHVNPNWPRTLGQVEQSIPPQLRAVTLIVNVMINPYYRNRLSAEERAGLMSVVNARAEHLMSSGFKRAIVAGEHFEEADYVDAGHISVSGGRKLAADLAPIIREMAIELAYLP